MAWSSVFLFNKVEFLGRYLHKMASKSSFKEFAKSLGECNPSMTAKQTKPDQMFPPSLKSTLKMNSDSKIDSTMSPETPTTQKSMSLLSTASKTNWMTSQTPQTRGNTPISDTKKPTTKLDMAPPTRDTGNLETTDQTIETTRTSNKISQSSNTIIPSSSSVGEKSTKSFLSTIIQASRLTTDKLTPKEMVGRRTTTEKASIKFTDKRFTLEALSDKFPEKKFTSSDTSMKFQLKKDKTSEESAESSDTDKESQSQEETKITSDGEEKPCSVILQFKSS